MDLAQQLLRSCVRAFYDTKHVLVIDALIIHSALRDDDLVYLMNTNSKDLHKLCGRLREDRFLSVHVRAETKEGQQRPQSKTYYFIDYRATIDAIKWRVFNIDKAVQGTTTAEDERKEYFCGWCKSEWTMMDVLGSRDSRGLLCPKCNELLQYDPENNRGGHEQSTKLNAQFKFITDLLPKIDQAVIPENTFEHALAVALSVIRDAANPASETAPVETKTAKATTVKGMAVGPTSISVTLTTSDGPSEAELAADKARKAAISAQNALPVHFTHSTVTQEQVKFGQQHLFSSSQLLEDDKKNLGLNTPSVNGADDDVDDYFALLKAEAIKEAQKEKEEEDESDGDEDDFEDVVPNGTGSGAATPASSVGGGETKNTPQPSMSGLTGVLKKGGSASASGTSTGATSPVTGPGTPNEDGRPSKKVRIEEPIPKGDDEESEEDMEFEDV